MFVDDKDFRKNINLSVVHRDGSEDIIADGGVVLVGGANVNFEIAEDSDEITVQVNPGIGFEDPYYRQKYNALVDLNETNTNLNPITGPYPDPDTGVTPDGPPWSFTNKSVWIVSINNTFAEAETNVIFVNSSSCTNIGQFNMDDGYPEINPGELSILDICVPCTDCDIYNRLYEYIARLSAFLDYHLQLIMNTDTENPPIDPDGETPLEANGLYRQLLASQRFWDHQVHRASFKCASQSQGSSITSVAYYNNISVDTIGDAGGNGITVTYQYNFFRNGVSWAGVNSSVVDLRLLPREGADDPPDRIRTYTLSTAYGSGTITATCTTFDDSLPGPRLLPSGGILYSDIALLLKDSTLFDDGDDYTVEIITTIDLTHIRSPGNPDGIQTCRSLVYLVPAEEEPSST
jgi:hypothetical protein